MELWFPCVLLVTMHQGAAASNVVVMASMKGTAQLPCNFPEYKAMNRKEMVVYWQKEALPEPEVVHETFNDQEKLDYLNPKYINRNRLDPNSLALDLLDVCLDDEGTYSCIVQRRDDRWLRTVHRFHVQLKVTANFSRPEITPVPGGKMKRGTTVELVCSSDQGYPEPHGTHWVVSNRNGTLNYSGEMHTYQDTDTKLYNVTCTLTLPFTGETNLSCVIHHNEGLGFISSETLSIEEDIEENSASFSSFHAIWIVSLLIVMIALVVFVVFEVKKRKKRKKCSNHHDGAPEVTANRQPKNGGENVQLMDNSKHSNP